MCVIIGYKRRCLFIIYSLKLINTFSAQSIAIMNGSNSIIKTLSGPVKGLIKNTDTGKEYFSFQHIPYAKRLEGEWRFKDPRPVETWTETLDATKEGDASYQFDIWRPDPVLTGGDNCLALNVYSPNVRIKTQSNHDDLSNIRYYDNS